MCGKPVLGLMRDGDTGLKVIETERGPIAPCAGLILERAGEGRRKERTLLTDILPDRGVDVAASELVRGLFGGSHRVALLKDGWRSHGKRGANEHFTEEKRSGESARQEPNLPQGRTSGPLAKRERI
jgi:hypothetical protein